MSIFICSNKLDAIYSANSGRWLYLSILVCFKALCNNSVLLSVNYIFIKIV